MPKKYQKINKITPCLVFSSRVACVYRTQECCFEAVWLYRNTSSCPAVTEMRCAQGPEDICWTSRRNLRIGNHVESHRISDLKVIPALSQSRGKAQKGDFFRTGPQIQFNIYWNWWSKIYPISKHGNGKSSINRGFNCFNEKIIYKCRNCPLSWLPEGPFRSKAW